MLIRTTLYDLVDAVAEECRGDAETADRVGLLLNSGNARFTRLARPLSVVSGQVRLFSESSAWETGSLSSHC